MNTPIFKERLYPIGYQLVTGELVGLNSLAMEWKTLRSAFIGLREELDLTQDAVAKRGKLPQSAISKLESNDNLGPAAEVFVKAVLGLGVSLPYFFARISGSQTSDSRGHLKSDQKSLQTSKPSDKTTLLSQRGAHSESSGVSRDDELRQLRDEIAQLRAASIEAGAILIGSGSGGRKLTPPRDSLETGRTRSPRTRTR